MKLERLLAAAAAAVALAGAWASLYSRAALADTNTRVSVLEAQRVEDAKKIDSIDQKVTDIHRWMMEDRRNRQQYPTP